MLAIRHCRGRKSGDVLIPLRPVGIRYLFEEQRGRWKQLLRDAVSGKVSLTNARGDKVSIARTFGREVEIDLGRRIVRKFTRGDVAGYSLLKAQYRLLITSGVMPGATGTLFPGVNLLHDDPEQAAFECSMAYLPIHPGARTRWAATLGELVPGALLPHFEATCFWMDVGTGLPVQRILGAFVHGDLAGDHVRVGHDGKPALIDWMYGPAPFVIEALRLESGLGEKSPHWHEVGEVLAGLRGGFSDGFAQGTWPAFRDWATGKFGTVEAQWLRVNLAAACRHVAAHEEELLRNGGERYRLGIMVAEAMKPGIAPSPSARPMRWMVLASSLDERHGYGVLCRSLIGGLAKDAALTLDVFSGKRTGWWRGRHALGSERILDRPRFWRGTVLLDLLVLLFHARGRYDGVLVLVEHYAAAGWKFARLKGIPCVVTQHGTYAVRLPSELPYYSRVWEGVDKVMPVSGYTRRRMEEEGLRCNYQVITPGVDKSRFAPPSTVRRPEVVFVGNLKERKGLDFLLDAFTAAQKQMPAIRLKIIGAIDKSSRKFSDVSDRIHRDGLNVEFTGTLTDPELARTYAGARLHVLPSRSLPYFFEGFGLVHLEANASGTLTVGTRNSGNEDAIRDGFGHLVEYGDTSVLTAIILHAMTVEPYPELALDSLRSWEDMAREYRDLLDSLCESGHSGPVDAV